MHRSVFGVIIRRQPSEKAVESLDARVPDAPDPDGLQTHSTKATRSPTVQGRDVSGATGAAAGEPLCGFDEGDQGFVVQVEHGAVLKKKDATAIAATTSLP